MNIKNFSRNDQLVSAISRGDFETVQNLLNQNVNINAQNQHGETVLMRAVWEGNRGMVELLLSHEANIHVSDQEGWTALKYAEELQDPEIINLLKQGVATTVLSESPTSLQALKRTLDTSPSRDWRDAVMIGSIIGGLIVMLIGFFNSKMLQQSVANLSDSSSNSSSNSISASVPSSSSSITEQDAINLINQWFRAKREIFASPFNRELVAKFATDILYSDITKPNGSIDWLIANNAYYKFGVQQVESAGKFASSSDSATIEVNVTEELTLYVNGRIDNTQTGFDTSRFRYSLRFVDGSWKIADYKHLNSIEK
jgi:hypothetical protein